MENKISTNKAKPEGVEVMVGTMGEIFKSSYHHPPPPFVVTLVELHCQKRSTINLWVFLDGI